MPIPLITLTTDFGVGSPYVAAMKGALLTVNSAVQLLDLSHFLPPQDLRACSYFLRSALSFYPAGTLHVVVVDPGVGTARALLYVETNGQRLLVPDNGCWTEFARLSSAPPRVLHLTEQRFWRPEVSSTFHGRDILAPVAGHLSLGVEAQLLGRPATSWVELALPVARITQEGMEGEVLFVDDFGNLITNLAGSEFLRRREHIKTLLVDDRAVPFQAVRTYGEAAMGELIMLASSGGTVEIAEVRGNAARRLGAKAGTSVSALVAG